MKKNIIATLLFSSFILSSQAFASAITIPENLPFSQVNNANKGEQNVVSLQSSADSIVQKNYLTMILSYKKSGDKSEIIQTEVANKINAAIAYAKKKEKSDDFKVKTGQFSIYPRYDQSSIIGWDGAGSIILEGKDFATISQVASELEGLTITNIETSVSPEKIKSEKSETVKKAIDNFKSDSMLIARQFGFDTYQIKSISVDYQQPNQFQRPMMAMLMARDSLEKSAPTVEAGDQTLTANVSGTIILMNIIR